MLHIASAKVGLAAFSAGALAFTALPLGANGVGGMLDLTSEDRAQVMIDDADIDVRGHSRHDADASVHADDVDADAETSQDATVTAGRSGHTPRGHAYGLYKNLIRHDDSDDNDDDDSSSSVSSSSASSVSSGTSTSSASSTTTSSVSSSAQSSVSSDDDGDSSVSASVDASASADASVESDDDDDDDGLIDFDDEDGDGHHGRGLLNRLGL